MPLKWQEELDRDFYINKTKLTLMFADDQIVIAHDEYSLQKALLKSTNVTKDYTLKILQLKQKYWH